MIVDEKVYLEHFGVKGMRWGQRRKSKPPLSNWEKGQRRMRRVNTASQIAAGALFAAAIFGSSSGKKTKRSIPISTFNVPNIKMTAAKRHVDAIVMGPIGSTGVARLKGAIPL